jgi:hypothetical protein
MTSNPFPLPIDGYFVPGHTRRFVLESSFIYQDPQKNWIVTVPAGFETDFNSSPRGMWNLFAPWDYPEAGLVHDWLYQHPDRLERMGSSLYRLGRRECDDIHRRILDILGCSWWKRQGAYTLIRLGGWVPWNKYRQKEQNSLKLPDPADSK